MSKWGIFAGAVALCVAGQARADGTWSCSVIEEGKAQVIKIVVAKGAATVSDWKSRIIAKYMTGSGSDPFRVISDNADGLIVVGAARESRDQGVGIDVIAIDKGTDMMTLTTVATASKVTEMKGRCTQ